MWKSIYGFRDGKKRYGEELNELEGTKLTFHEIIHIARAREYDFGEVSCEIDDLVETAKTFDKMETVREMKQIVPEYESNNSVYEVLNWRMGNENKVDFERRVGFLTVENNNVFHYRLRI